MRDPVFLEAKFPREKPDRMAHPERAGVGFSPVDHASQVVGLIDHDIALAEVSMKQSHG